MEAVEGNWWGHGGEFCRNLLAGGHPGLHSAAAWMYSAAACVQAVIAGRHSAAAYLSPVVGQDLVKVGPAKTVEGEGPHLPLPSEPKLAPRGEGGQKVRSPGAPC